MVDGRDHDRSRVTTSAPTPTASSRPATSTTSSSARERLVDLLQGSAVRPGAGGREALHRRGRAVLARRPPRRRHDRRIVSIRVGPTRRPTDREGARRGRSGTRIAYRPTTGRSLVVRGEIDMATAPKLRDRLNELVDAGATRIVLDCRGLDFLDSSGIGVLIAVRKRLGDDGRPHARVAARARPQGARAHRRERPRRDRSLIRISRSSGRGTPTRASASRHRSGARSRRRTIAARRAARAGWPASAARRARTTRRSPPSS